MKIPFLPRPCRVILVFIATVVTVVFAVELSPSQRILLPFVPILPSATYDYLIITSTDPGMTAQAARIAADKTMQGYTTKVTTVETINNTESGADTAARIRACISRLCATGTRMVLLLGDYRLVPARVVYCDNSMQEPPVRSDVYYQSLGPGWETPTPGLTRIITHPDTWFYDSSGALVHRPVPPDTFIPDYTVHTCVGRLPASNATEAAVMADKVIAWSRTPAAQFTYSFCGTMVVSRDYNGITDAANFLCNSATPALRKFAPSARRSFLCIDAVDSSDIATPADLNVDKSGYIAQLGQNPALQMVIAHGWYDLIQFKTEGSKMTLADVSALDGAGARLMLSLSCRVMRMPAESTQQCYAKGYLTNPKGGANGFFGCAVDDDLHQWQGRMASMCALMADSGAYPVALALALSQGSNKNQENRFKSSHQYWGDPAMVLRRVPVTATDTIAMSVDIRPDQWTITLNPTAQGAVVCLSSGGRILARGMASESTVIFDTVPPFTTAILTASHRDFLTSSMMIDSAGFKVSTLRRSPVAFSGTNLRVIQQAGSLRITYLCDAPGTALTVYNVAGRRITHSVAGGTGIQLTVLPKLPAGNYLVHLQSGRESVLKVVTVTGR